MAQVTREQVLAAADWAAQLGEWHEWYCVGGTTDMPGEPARLLVRDASDEAEDAIGSDCRTPVVYARASSILYAAALEGGPMPDGWELADPGGTEGGVSLHVYTAKAQPLTRYVLGNLAHRPVDLGDQSMAFTVPPRALYWCERCRRRRWASKLRIQVYYDCSRIFCAEPCERPKQRQVWRAA